MMYPFMTLEDNTEIVHSEMLPENRVKVYVEKPDAKDCFHDMTCYKWIFQRKSCRVFGNNPLYGSSYYSVCQPGRTWKGCFICTFGSSNR